MSGAKTDEQANSPPGWVHASLEEVCQINPLLERYIGNDAVEVNFVPMRAVEPEGGGLVRPEVRHYGEVKRGYTPFVSGDVIMAKITPCMENGKTTAVPDLPGLICFGSTEFHVIRPEAGVSAKWIGPQSRSARNDRRRWANAGTSHIFGIRSHPSGADCRARTHCGCA